jgi:hypothetical protein
MDAHEREAAAAANLMGAFYGSGWAPKPGEEVLTREPYTGEWIPAVVVGGGGDTFVVRLENGAHLESDIEEVRRKPAF